MKLLLNVRRYLMAVLMVPGFTLSSADASLFGIFDDTHTVHVHNANDMEKVNKYYDKVEVILHTDINATYKNLDKGIFNLRHLWDEDELYNKLDPVFTGENGVAYSLTFDGQGKTVGQVVAKGRAEFTGLGDVTIRNMVNAELDESHSLYKGIGKIGILTGGAMNCDNGLLRNIVSNEPAGISMTGNNSVTVDNIYVDLDKAGGRLGSMTGTTGGAFFSHSQGINISSNKNDVSFTNITVAFDRRLELMPNMAFTFGGAIFTSNLNIDDNGGVVRFADIKTFIDTEALGVDFLKIQSGMGSGGALFLTHDSSISGNKGGVIFENCSISNYYVSTGGAIALSFGANIADIEAGFNEALTLDINNNSSKTGQAAVQFKNNSVTANKEEKLMPNMIYGGAVAINRGSTLNMKGNDGILFESNKVECDNPGILTHLLIGGGAIFVDTRMDTDPDRGGSTLSITDNNGDVDFRYNSSSLYGGAILAHCSAQADISNNEDVSFVANKAAYSGGAIAILYYADVNIDGNNSVTFARNEAMNSESGHLKNALGGAILTQGYFSLSRNNNVFFTENSVAASDEALGGAITLTDTDDGTATLNITYNKGNVFFTRNNAYSNKGTARGGAIYGDANTVINISSNDTVRFESNRASDEGQAIYTEGELTIAGNNSVTFSGHEGHAIYVSGSSASLEISAGKGQSVLFDDDSLYADGSDVVFNGSSCNGGDIRFIGSNAKAIAHNGNITMGKGILHLSQSAGLQATSINLEAGATLYATGTGNSVQGKLNMLASTSTLALHVGTANRCTGDLETMTLTGNAVLDLTGTIAGTENFTLAVTLDSLQENGAYKLLSLTGAFSEEQWSAVNITGDIVRENLLWNKDYTALYYLHAEEAHDGDRIWTNKAGSGTWNFMARNWMVDVNGEQFDGVKYRDRAQTETLIPIGVRFMDDCDSPVDVSITDVVSPRDILVEAERDYTFADGGGKISGTGSLTKNGSGTLTIALNNDFTGDFALNAGTVRAQADDALGKGNFSSEVGSTLVVENKAQVTLSEGDKQTSIKGAVEVDRGAALHITPNNIYQASSSKIDGTLKFTNFGAGSGSGAGTLSGSGTIELYNSSTTRDLTIKFAKNEGFIGNISLGGTNSSLIITDGGYNGSGTISVIGANKLTMAGSTGMSLTKDGMLHLQDGAQITAHDVTIGNGATLKVAGADNRIELQRSQGGNDSSSCLNFEGGSTLDITLAMVNAIPEKNIHAALEVNHLAYFNKGSTTATTINVSLSDDMTFGHQYALVYAENGYQYYADEWNENCINVTGDLLFSDLQWIDSDGNNVVDTLILDAPNTVVWTDAQGSDVWNTEGDKNWKRFTNRESAVFRTDDKVCFTDTCTNPAAVRITEAVNPEEILVRAERDYTFADGGGKIIGEGKLTKEGNGTLTIELANEFSGAINISQGTVRVLHAGALGSGTLHLGKQGTLGVDGNTSLTVNDFYAEGQFVVNKGSTLELKNSKLFNTTNCTIDGTLLLTSSDKLINYGTTTVSGAGLLQLRGGNNCFVISDFASSRFTGTLSVEGSGNTLCIDTDDKSSRAHLVVNGNYGNNATNIITVIDSSATSPDDWMNTIQVLHLASGGSLTLNDGGVVEAKQVVIGSGAALRVSGTGNSITGIPSYALHLLDGSTLDVTLSSANKLDAGIWNEAALITNVNPVFGAASAEDTAPAAGAQVNLHLTIADYSALESGQSYVLLDLRTLGKFEATAENWNEQLINVTGDALFSDLKWITPSYTDNAPPSNSMLVFNAPDAIVWRNSNGTGVWNTEGDKNWKRFTAFDADEFRTGDNVRFTDSCTDGADVSISGVVSPGSILVRAERDYTFTGDGKITGSGTLTKQGSGILTLNMVNESTGGVDLQEGIIRVSDNQALGTGQLNTAQNTLLTVEESATVELAANGGAIRGYVGIIGDAELKITGKSTYAAQATAVVGTLQFAGQSEGGQTDNLRGRGTVLLNTEAKSRFTIAENKNYTGSLIAQGVANIIEVTSGGYYGNGTLAATADNAVLQFEGQDIILERDGVLQTAEGGYISAATITLEDRTTLLAGHTPETGDDSAAVAAIATLSLAEASTPSTVTLEADELTLTGGSVYQQNDAWYSLKQVDRLVLDGTNGLDFTLTTNLEAYRYEDSLYYVLFTDVAQDAWKTLGNVNFTITGHNAPTELGYHAESRTLYLKTSEAVPEPTTATLSLLALAALAARRRRR